MPLFTAFYRRALPRFLKVQSIIDAGAIGSVDRFEIPHPEHIQQPLIQMIVDELLGEGKSPSTGRSGAMTNRVMDSILRSRRSPAG